MKKIIALGFILAQIYFTSCQKELSMDTNGQPVPASPNHPLTPDPPSGTLIVKRVDTWSGNPVLTIDSFEYDGNDRLISEYLTFDQQYTIRYDRDGQERITRITRTSNGQSAFLNVFYASATSTQVAYTLIPPQNAGSTPKDSTVYTYNAEGRVNKTTRYEFADQVAKPASYTNYGYDAKNNLAALETYLVDDLGQAHFNIGYQFTYDNKVNPFFSVDDALLADNWYISASPNNLVKQVNHYSGAGSIPDDFIELSYTYASDGRPGTAARSGPAIGSSVVSSMYTYK